MEIDALRAKVLEQAGLSGPGRVADIRCFLATHPPPTTHPVLVGHLSDRDWRGYVRASHQDRPGPIGYPRTLGHFTIVIPNR